MPFALLRHAGGRAERRILGLIIELRAVHDDLTAVADEDGERLGGDAIVEPARDGEAARGLVVLSGSEGAQVDARGTRREPGPQLLQGRARRPLVREARANDAHERSLRFAG